MFGRPAGYAGRRMFVCLMDDGLIVKLPAHVAKEELRGGKAAPFEFDLTFTGNDYDLTGRGKGDRTFTDAAYADLQKLTGKDVLALLSETKAVKGAK